MYSRNVMKEHEKKGKDKVVKGVNHDKKDNVRGEEDKRRETGKKI